MPAASSTASVLILEDSGTHTDRLLAKLRSEGGVSLEWERVSTLPALREALGRRRDWELIVSDSQVTGAAAFQALAVTHEIAPGIPFVVLSRGRAKQSVAHVIQEWVAHRPAKEDSRPGGNPESRISRSQLFDFARRLLEAQEAERRHIARELHDEFGQLLTAVRLNLEAAQRQRGAAATSAMAEAMALVSQAIHQVRNFAVELWPTVLDDLGLPAALRWLTENQMKAATFMLRLELDAVPRLPRSVEVTCFRVVQESLTNIARHAAAREVHIKLQASTGTVAIMVRDDGLGFDVEAVRRRAAHGGPPSFGLLGMQERVLMEGGRFQIDSAPGQGTTVSAGFSVSAAEVSS